MHRPPRRLFHQGGAVNRDEGLLDIQVQHRPFADFLRGTLVLAVGGLTHVDGVDQDLFELRRPPVRAPELRPDALLVQPAADFPQGLAAGVAAEHLNRDGRCLGRQVGTRRAAFVQAALFVQLRDDVQAERRPAPLGLNPILGAAHGPALGPLPDGVALHLRHAREHGQGELAHRRVVKAGVARHELPAGLADAGGDVQDHGGGPSHAVYLGGDERVGLTGLDQRERLLDAGPGGVAGPGDAQVGAQRRDRQPHLSGDQKAGVPLHVRAGAVHGLFVGGDAGVDHRAARPGVHLACRAVPGRHCVIPFLGRPTGLSPAGSAATHCLSDAGCSSSSY